MLRENWKDTSSSENLSEPRLKIDSNDSLDELQKEFDKLEQIEHIEKLEKLDEPKTLDEPAQRWNSLFFNAMTNDCRWIAFNN